MSLKSRFLENESGAVTVDWVVLTAAIVGIAIAVLTVISGGLNSASNATNDGINSAADNSIASLITGSNAGMYGTASGFTAYQMGTVGVPGSGYDQFYDQASTGDTQAYYNMAYTSAVDSPGEMTMDRLAAAEQAMLDSGQTIPTGNTSAASLQGTFEGNPV